VQSGAIGRGSCGDCAEGQGPTPRGDEHWGVRRYAILLLPVLVWAVVVVLMSEPGRRLLSREDLANPVVLLIVLGTLLPWLILAAVVGLSAFLAVDYGRDRRRRS
jgi:hypothetical protein